MVIGCRDLLDLVISGAEITSANSSSTVQSLAITKVQPGIDRAPVLDWDRRFHLHTAGMRVLCQQGLGVTLDGVTRNRRRDWRLAFVIAILYDR